jgi:hypothetical protein
MRKPYFGSTASLVNTDFQATAGKTGAFTFSATPSSNWYQAVLNNASIAYLNRTGTNQFRLRFAKDDNDNLVADYMKFHSGEAPAASRPQLVITYYVP